MGRPQQGGSGRRWLPWQGDAYLAAIMVAAGLIFAFNLRLWPQPFAAGPWLWIELTALGVVGINFPLEVGHKVKLTVTMAVYFAAMLIFPTPAALASVAVAQLIGGVAVSLRLRAAGKRIRGPRTILFNIAQLVLVFGLGSLTYHLFLPRLAPAPLDRFANLWAIPAAAAVLYLTNSLAVSVMAAIQLGKSPAEIWLADQRLDKIQYAALYLVGLVTALIAPRYVVAPLVMALPTALIYLSLKRTRELVEQTVSAIEAMAELVDTRDPNTYQHSLRVSEVATQIARRMSLPGEEIDTIRSAARVHDLGKIGVPDSVLRKQGGLDEDERKLMERHPEIGYELLSRFPEYRKGRELVRAHHERFDGRGYPLGLCGDESPIGAQVIAVADAFDAMTSDRPYRRGMSREEAVERLLRGSGTQWHPRVVEALVAVLGVEVSQPAQLRVMVGAS